jgi:hypothetical protein
MKYLRFRAWESDSFFIAVLFPLFVSALVSLGESDAVFIFSFHVRSRYFFFVKVFVRFHVLGSHA